jgi:hypothetical protein
MKDWLLSVVWYGSLLTTLLGTLVLLSPFPAIGLTSRSHGAWLVAIAIVLIAVLARSGPATAHVSTATSALDRLMPAYQFCERHWRAVDARAERVLAGIADVTPGDIALFRTFTTIRRLGRSGPESILNAPPHESILAVATRTGFDLLARTDNEVVLGLVIATHARPVIDRSAAGWFEQVAGPGVVKAALNFRVDPLGPDATRLTTETRVLATDTAGLHRFTPYWRTVFPGSWILRVTWLAAIARRAELS